jgi:hypothetical protein
MQTLSTLMFVSKYDKQDQRGKAAFNERMNKLS